MKNKRRLAFQFLGKGYIESFWEEVLSRKSLSKDIAVIFAPSKTTSVGAKTARFYPHESGPNERKTGEISIRAIYALRNPPAGVELETVFNGLNKLLDRRDFSGTFRNADRQTLIRLRLLEYLQILESEKITGVIAESLPHNFESMCLYEAARILEIPFLTFEVCGLADVVFPVTALGDPNRMLYKSVSRKDESEELEAAKIIIEQRFRMEMEKRSSADIAPTYMVEQEKASNSRKDPLGLTLRAMRRVGRIVFSPLSDSERLAAEYTFHHQNWMPIRMKNALNYFSEVGMRLQLEKGTRAIVQERTENTVEYLYALGFEPESTTFPEGLPYQSQLDAIYDIRSIIPEESLLWVKEHPSQQFRSMRGYLGYGSIFLRAIAGLDKTQLLSGSYNIKKDLRDVKVIFTLTGTIAVEAALRGVRVISLGSPWWAGMPGTESIRDLDGNVEKSNLEHGITRNEIETFLLERVLLFGIPHPVRSYFGSEEPSTEDPLHRAGVDGAFAAINDWLNKIEKRGS